MQLNAWDDGGNAFERCTFPFSLQNSEKREKDMDDHG